MKELLKKIRDTVLFHLPKSIAHRLIYYKYHSSRLNLKSPNTYDEKTHWLMTYVYDEKYGKYADKIEVRNYVIECGLENLLIPLVGKGIYKSSYDIDFRDLPHQFIIKANHGSGDKYYYLCNDKDKIDFEEVREELEKSLKYNYAKFQCQYHYAGIKPAFLVEKLLVENNQQRPTDYKVVCSFGTPIAILVCKDRNKGRDYYSPTWNYLDYVKPEFRSGEYEDAPVVLDEMLNASSVLSRPFPLARIDFYVIDGKLFFGEITLTPSAGNTRYLNQKGQEEIGKSIDVMR